MIFDLEPQNHRPSRRSRRKACPRCDGRGWITSLYAHRIDDWADPCPKCYGAGKIRSMQLARALGVNRRDVYKVDTLTAGSKVGQRVLDAIARVFPEALS